MDARALLLLGRLALVLASGCSSDTGVSILRELFGLETIAKPPAKTAEGDTEGFCEGVEGREGVVCVEAEFGVGVQAAKRKVRSRAAFSSFFEGRRPSITGMIHYSL